MCENGQPLTFGAGGDKGLRLVSGKMELEIVTVGENGVTEEDVLVHDETNKMMAHLLAAMRSPAFPTAIGVLYCDPAPTYEAAVHEQLASEKEKKPNTDLNTLLRQGSTWTVD